MSSGDDEPKSGEAVTNVESIFSALRPSVHASVSLPGFAVACSAPTHVLGEWAVSIRVRTAPSFPLHDGPSAINKINNYKGTTSAMSSLEVKTAAVTRQQQVEVGKAKGGDARGIPPRGRPV